MFPAREDILRLAPELVLCLSGILLMLIEPFLTRARRAVLVTVAALGAALALICHDLPAMRPGTAFSGLLRDRWLQRFRPRGRRRRWRSWW